MSGQVKPERGGRLFCRFGMWSLVPDEDLLNLRQSLRQVQNLVGQAVAGELLGLVDQELYRRAHAGVPKGADLRDHLGY